MEVSNGPVVPERNAPPMSGIGGLSDAAQATAPSFMPQPQVTQQNTTPPPDTPGTHSKLISMLQHGLIGLGAAGKAIATQGRQGGVAEVQQIQSEQDADARAQQEQDIRKKALVTEMNLRQMETANLLQNMTQDRKKYGLDLLKNWPGLIARTSGAGFCI